MGDNQHSLATYVSDMLAVERHIRTPFGTQMDDGDFSEYGEARALLGRLCDTADRHINDLKQCLDDLGGHEASPIKSAVLKIEGFFAGAIDKVRKTKVSKGLRDDYTALALCTAGYTMLAATANAMGEPQVATLAQRLLRDYAQCIMEIGNALPGVVVKELADNGLAVDDSTIEQSRRFTQEAWRPQDASIGGTVRA
ncbi:MAG: DUF892 family protein [Candidatus Eremiobacteraeota bacterium]|nr:DUF892 family protein [Candidatus Eremiobacteraeota bacterium]